MLPLIINLHKDEGKVVENSHISPNDNRLVYSSYLN